jgi:chromosome segregation ATPase
MYWYLISISRAGWLVLACALLSPLALAEPKGDGGKSAMRRLEQRARSAEQAKSAAEAKLTTLGEEAEKAKSQAASLSKRRSVLEKELSALRQEKAALVEKLEVSETTLATRNQELTNVSASLADREARLATTQKNLDQTQQERQTYLADLGLRTQELGSCNTKNDGLHKTAEDILKRYKEKTCMTAILEKEPVTGLQRVKLENEIDEYRDKLERDATLPTQQAKRKELEQAEAVRRSELDSERQRLEQRERATADARKQQKLLEQKNLVESESNSNSNESQRPLPPSTKTSLPTGVPEKDDIFQSYWRQR